MMFVTPRLLIEGATVVAYDPQVNPNIVNDHDGLAWAMSALEAARGADAVAVMCEWPEFFELDLKALQLVMNGRVLADGRYVWPRKVVEALGFMYVV